MVFKLVFSAVDWVANGEAAMVEEARRDDALWLTNTEEAGDGMWLAGAPAACREVADFNVTVDKLASCVVVVRLLLLTVRLEAAKCAEGVPASKADLGADVSWVLTRGALLNGLTVPVLA